MEKANAENNVFTVCCGGYVCKLSFAIYLRLEGIDTFRNPLDYPDLKLGRLY